MVARATEPLAITVCAFETSNANSIKLACYECHREIYASPSSARAASSYRTHWHICMICASAFIHLSIEFQPLTSEQVLEVLEELQDDL